MGGIELPCDLPLPYSPELSAEYERVADAVIDQVLEAFADFRANPTLDSRKWKLVKQRENVQIYYQRERNPPSALHKPLPVDTASSRVLAQSDWSPMVKLLVTGTTLGSVDDAMYGSVSPTDLTALMKSISVQDDFYHHKTLRHIKLPTVEEPFTYVGLKWRARSSYIASLIKARDMVLIESTGFRQVEIDGKLERIGYALYHSVDLPEVAPLFSQGILRSKYSACVLYRQQAPGVVEVFSTTSLQPAGELMFKVTAFQAAEALIAVTKLTESAMKKKLVWMQAARAYGAPNATSEYTPMWRSMRHSFSGSFKVACDQCSRELKGLRATTKCEICTTPVCSRCITSRKLVFGYKIEELDYRSVSICKGCISTAVHMDNAPALAVYEFVQPFDRLRELFNKPSRGVGEAKRPKRRFSSAAQQPLATQLTDLSLEGFKLPDSRGSRATDERTTSCADLDEASEGQPTSTSRDETPKRFSDEATREQVRLWQQINNLCLQAEETYRLAVQQTSVIRQHSLDEQD